jgi:hypothetical protein
LIRDQVIEKGETILTVQFDDPAERQVHQATAFADRRVLRRHLPKGADDLGVAVRLKFRLGLSMQVD